MDFESQLKAEISRRNTDFMTAAVDGSEEYFDIVWQLMKKGSHPVPHRASWVISTCYDRWPDLLQPYLHDMIDYIPKAEHTGIKRLLLRILVTSDIPSGKLGEVLNICFDYMEKEMPVAVKVHAMQIIYNISEKEPDLKPELIALIESQLPFQSKAFTSRGKKLLKKLYKETRGIKT